MLKIILPIFCIASSFYLQNAAADEYDPAAANTGYYYFSGKVYECMKGGGIGEIRDEKTEQELIRLISRDKIFDDATKAISETKPKWLKETLSTWMLISARYQEGRNSISVMGGKDTSLTVDECNSLAPYVEKIF